MKNVLFTLGTVALLGFTTACASAPRGDDGARDTMIQVENHNSLLVSVEAISDGADFNLGQVETADTKTFELPDAINEVYDLQVRIDPIGSADSYVSDDILYSPGDLIRVDVESSLDLTTVTVR